MTMKTELDNMLDDALDKYREKFGLPFPLYVGRQNCYRTSEEIIQRIEECISSGNPEPIVENYRPDVDY